jgi:hypothetical protein
VELAKQHDVTVVVPYSTYKYEDFEKKNNLKIEFFNDRESIAPKIKLRFFRLVKMVYSWLFEYPAIRYFFEIPRYFKREVNYDLLISIAAPHPIHWGCCKAFKNNKNLAGKWIADCGDPYMGDTASLLRHPFYFKYFECNFCKTADYITIPVESALNAYYPQFRNKIKIIPQGFDLSEISKYRNQVDNKVPTFAYAGTFYLNYRDPRALLDFLCSLNIDFRFVIYAKMSSFLSPYVDVLKDKLIVRDFIPREELLEVLSQMDFLINFDNDTDVQSPSKLIDYFIVDRPVLSITKNFQTDSFMQFLNKDYSNRLIIDNLEKYDIKNVAKQFIELVEQR